MECAQSRYQKRIFFEIAPLEAKIDVIPSNLTPRIRGG